MGKRTSTPELDKLLALSECFHVTLDELTGGTPCEADTGSVRRTKTDGFRQTTQKVGIGLCVLGAVLLLAVGAVMLAVPDAADRLNESSAVTLNGSGLLLVLCVLFMAAGLALILRKGETAMKTWSIVFAALAVLLSDVMCAVVAYLYRDMLCGIAHDCYSAPAGVAFLYAIPFAAGIIICAALACVLKKKA